MLRGERVLSDGTATDHSYTRLRWDVTCQLQQDHTTPSPQIDRFNPRPTQHILALGIAPA